jgi:hypothetical protein
MLGPGQPPTITLHLNMTGLTGYSVVVSCFAIIILSVLGSLFQVCCGA